MAHHGPEELTVTCSPIIGGVPVVGGWHCVVTDAGDMGQIIPLTLKVEGPSPPSPYDFDHVSYHLSGELRTADSSWIAPVTDLKDAEGNWLISDIVVVFAVRVGNITVVTRATNVGGSTTPERVQLRVAMGQHWSVPISAMPRPNYRFDHWSVEGAAVLESAGQMQTRVGGTGPGYDATVVCKAAFVVKGNPTDPPGGGTHYGPSGPQPGDPGWSRYAFVVLYVNSSPAGIATTTPDDGIIYVGYPGDTETITCTARRAASGAEGYEFLGWSWSGDGIQNPVVTPDVDGLGGTLRLVVDFPSQAEAVKVVRCTANYRIPDGTFRVTTSGDPEAGGSTTGDGDYAPDAICVAVATAADGYAFIKWKNGKTGTVVSRDAEYAFRVTEDTDLTALFHFWTNLILRSATTGGQILRDAGGLILRDS